MAWPDLPQTDTTRTALLPTPILSEDSDIVHPSHPGDRHITIRSQTRYLAPHQLCSASASAIAQDKIEELFQAEAQLNELINIETKTKSLRHLYKFLKI